MLVLLLQLSGDRKDTGSHRDRAKDFHGQGENSAGDSDELVTEPGPSCLCNCLQEHGYFSSLGLRQGDHFCMRHSVPA